jgi:hypothetical protein
MCYGPYGPYGPYENEAEESQQLQTGEAAIARVATAGIGPQTVSGDAGSVTQYPIRDYIAAANYLMGVAAANSPRRGVRMTRLVPDATVQGPRRGFRTNWLGGDWNGYQWP